MGSYFDDTSMLRRVHREMAVAASGPRALFMQAAHPVAFEGFFAHTGALDTPYERLRRTAQVMDTIAFGSRTDADRATRRVRAIHRQVRGELTQPAGRFPAGTPFAADDPELLLWVLATLVDSALVVYEHYVRSLSTAERDAYWQDYRIIGRLFGLEDHDMPLDIHGFDDYVRDMLAGPDLHVTGSARELALKIVLRPPVSPDLPAGAQARELHHRRPLARAATPSVRDVLEPGLRAHAARRGRVHPARGRTPCA